MNSTCNISETRPFIPPLLSYIVYCWRPCWVKESMFSPKRIIPINCPSSSFWIGRNGPVLKSSIIIECLASFDKLLIKDFVSSKCWAFQLPYSTFKFPLNEKDTLIHVDIKKNICVDSIYIQLVCRDKNGKVIIDTNVSTKLPYWSIWWSKFKFFRPSGKISQETRFNV